MRFLETEVTRGLGMDGELLLNGYRVSVWGDEILEGFPGGPVVKTACFHCRGTAGGVVRELGSCMPVWPKFLKKN